MFFRQAGIDKRLSTTAIFRSAEVSGSRVRSKSTAVNFQDTGQIVCDCASVSDQCRQSPRNAFTGHDRRGGRGDTLFVWTRRTAALLFAPIFPLTISTAAQSSEIVLPANFEAQAQVFAPNTTAIGKNRCTTCCYDF